MYIPGKELRMRRTKVAAALTREQLLQAALQIFRERGYNATTLEEIARRAGTTRGAIQWHFGSKADLFNTLVREQYQRAALRLKELASGGGSPLQTLRLLLVRWLCYAEEDPDFRTMLELTTLHTEIVPELAEGMQEKTQGIRDTVARFAELIRQGMAAGEVRTDIDVQAAATMALGIIYGVTTQWLIDPGAFSLKERAEEMVAIFIRGIARS
jgi:AcrR family transcriptional regulator